MLQGSTAGKSTPAPLHVWDMYLTNDATTPMMVTICNYTWRVWDLIQNPAGADFQGRLAAEVSVHRGARCAA